VLRSGYIRKKSCGAQVDIGHQHQPKEFTVNLHLMGASGDIRGEADSVCTAAQSEFPPEDSVSEEPSNGKTTSSDKTSSSSVDFASFA
jgi:hypothetical protein